jgi:hypothetical protein
MYRIGNVGSSAGPQDIWARIRTDAKGHLEIPSAPYREAIALIHESGYARVPLDTVSANKPIMLTPWGRIEGVLNIGQSPAVHQKVMACNQDDPPKDSFRYRYIAETDDQGRFAFSHVPAGPCMVARYYDVINSSLIDPSLVVNVTNTASEIMIRPGTVARPNLNQPPLPPPVRPNPIFIQNDYAGSTPGNSLEVKPGKVVNVSLGGKGRAIVGKMLATGYSGKIDWRKDLLIGLLISEKTLSASPMNLNRVPTADSTAGRSKDVIMPGYCVEFQPDGSFRINDVKPGAYRFNVRFSKTLTNAANADVTEVREIAYSNKQVLVSDPDQNSNKSIDLGEIELDIWPGSGRLLN